MSVRCHRKLASLTFCFIILHFHSIYCLPFQKFLTKKGVEHLLSIFKNVVPVIFTPTSEVASSSSIICDESHVQLSTPATSTEEGREKEQTGVAATEMDTISDILSPSSAEVLGELGFTMADFLNAFGMVCGKIHFLAYRVIALPFSSLPAGKHVESNP